MPNKINQTKIDSEIIRCQQELNSCLGMDVELKIPCITINGAAIYVENGRAYAIYNGRQYHVLEDANICWSYLENPDQFQRDYKESGGIDGSSNQRFFSASYYLGHTDFENHADWFTFRFHFNQVVQNTGCCTLLHKNHPVFFVLHSETRGGAIDAK